MSVGIGNFYRFPFTAYENGGGAFLIPYIIVLLTIGKPIYFLELAVGQFSSYGQVKCWRLAPFFKGKVRIREFEISGFSEIHISIYETSTSRDFLD
jgi:SNF family Na+-dependent transporter